MDTDIISESKTNEIIQTVAELEYSTLVKVLKASSINSFVVQKIKIHFFHTKVAVEFHMTA